VADIVFDGWCKQQRADATNAHQAVEDNGCNLCAHSWPGSCASH
jgi:hypothetical protein